MKLRPVSCWWCSIRLQKKAKADNAKANYERYAYLAETGAASQKDLDRYRTQYISAKAELDYSNLTTPSARHGC